MQYNVVYHRPVLRATELQSVIKSPNLLYSTESYYTARDVLFCFVMCCLDFKCVSIDRWLCLMVTVKWWAGILLTEMSSFPWIVGRLTLHDKFKESSFFLNFYFSKSKDSRKSYEAAGWSRSIWKQVRSYFYYLLCFHIYVFCVFFYFFDFLNHLLWVWISNFGRYMKLNYTTSYNVTLSYYFPLYYIVLYYIISLLLFILLIFWRHCFIIYF